jgi:hypothetical protein
MIKSTQILAAVLMAAAATPVAAQPYPYPDPNPTPYPYPQQPYPQQPYNPYPYPQPGYGGDYGYGGNSGVLGSIIDNVIGGRWGSDRQAVRQCTMAAVQQAENQYRPYFGPNWRRPYQGYNGYIRVSAITDVQHRMLVVRVRGLLDSGLYRTQYGNGGDLSFRCDVDNRGYVTNIRVTRR